MSRLGQWVADYFGRIESVAVADCLHFCGYRYGRSEANPYEEYAIALAMGQPAHRARERFIDTIRHYRPKTLNEALGAELSAVYPMWWLPWRRPQAVQTSPAWVDDPNRIVDVMTCFSERGIPLAGLEREFRWSENAFDAIRSAGYQPKKYGYVSARELRGATSAYLVTDGNHRMSAASALGTTRIDVLLPLGSAVVRSHAHRWPLVRAALMSERDAVAVFDSYFQLGRNFPRSATAAELH